MAFNNFIQFVACMYIVGCRVPSVPYNTTIMAKSDIILLHNITYVEVGSEIHLLCEANGKDTVSIAVCGEDGTWLPDLSEHRCIKNQGQFTI